MKRCIGHEALLLGKEGNLARHIKAQCNIGITVQYLRTSVHACDVL